MSIAYFRFYILNFSAALTFLFSFPYATVAQKIDLNSHWTDGHEFYFVERFVDGVFYFEGGNLHEGGASFALKLGKDGGHSIFHDTTRYSSSIPKSAIKIELKLVNELRVLIFRNSKSQIEWLLREAFPNEELKDLFIATKTNHELAGKYINAPNKKTVIFYPDKQVAEGITSVKNYEFGESYDIPEDAITFGNDKSFYYMVTEKGLDIYTGIDNSEEWKPGKKLMSLTKTEWLNSESVKEIPGKYPYASSIILIDKILSCYSSSKLALMRNEIFARHGLIFKSQSLKDYFEKQGWYSPTHINVDDKLSELEKLNIQLIQRYEAIRKKPKVE